MKSYFLHFSCSNYTSLTSVSSPDHLISPSGPGATARGSLGSPTGLPGSLGHGHPSPGIKYKAPLGPGIGGVVGDTDKDRRCSVISLNQTKPLMHFPVKNKKITREKFGDIRRPSDLWQGIYKYYLFKPSPQIIDVYPHNFIFPHNLLKFSLPCRKENIQGVFKLSLLLHKPNHPPIYQTTLSVPIS